MSFLDIVERARVLLERNPRVSRRALRREFELDEPTLDDLVDELVNVRGIARLEGEVLAANTGEPAATLPAKPPAPVQVPRTYTPKHLADRILQSRSALEGERKQVTVLFADVKGSMELAEQLDPEQWHQILERFFAILTDGVHRFEGTVNQYTGDGIMALFGAPLAHEDHAQRACYAALHLRDALRAYADTVRIAHGLNFSVRMGLNSGEVVVASIGDDLRMDYTAQGHTVGLAQRMEALAESGQALIAGSTRELVQGYFVLRDLGAMHVKGVTGPVHVAELQGVGAAVSRFDISRARGLSQFVGRDADMQILESALAESRAGNGQVIAISAEAGTGKSRLCFEFLERCRARGLSTQTGHALAHGKNIPLAPILEIFRAYFGIEERDPDQLVRDKIAGRLLLMDETYRDLLPVAFEYFGVKDPLLPMPVMDAETKQRQLFGLLRKLVRQVRADGQPVTLIEDLHWIDGASEAFLEQWVEAVAGSHALLVLNFRPEYQATWLGRSWVRQIPLRPLGPDAVHKLLRSLLGGDASIAGLADVVHRRAAGNPFFTEEIVRSLIESGALAGSRGNYRLITPIAQIEVPVTVQALLAARIDRLGDEEKHVLQTAAVIGKDFTEPVLRQVLGALQPPALAALPAVLSRLKEAEFILEVSLYPVAEYTFKHPLTQEVALRSQLQEQRRRTHAAVAVAVEQAQSARLDESAALIAWHHDEAGDITNAARWHRRAAEWMGMKDVSAAARHWQRVRELARQMGEGPEASELMLTACERALLVGGWRIGGSLPHWTAVFDDGCAAAARLQNASALVSLHNGYGVVAGIGVEGVARNYLKHTIEAVRQAESTDDLALRIAALCYQGLACLWNGLLRETMAVNEKVIALAAGDPHLGAQYAVFSPLISAVILRAVSMAYSGDPAAGIQQLSQARLLAETHGFQEQSLWSIFHEAELRITLGQPEGVSTLAQEVMSQYEDRDSASQSLAKDVLCAALSGEARWQALFEVATEALKTAPLHAYQTNFLVRISEAELALGHAEAARAAAAEAVSRIVAGRCSSRPDCYGALARAQLALNESAADITATLGSYAAVLDRTGFALFEGELHELQAVLARREGQSDQEKLAVQRARDVYRRFEMETHLHNLTLRFGDAGGPA